MSYDFPAHESTRKRRRWGCTCGCVMILIVLIIAGVIVGYIGFKPHGEFQRYAMMDANVDGFGVLRLNPEDTGVQEFTNYLFRRIEKSQQGADPAKAKVMAGALKVSKNFVTNLVQPESMIYAVYDPATADENVILSIPLKNWTSSLAVKQFVQSTIGQQPVEQIQGAEIYPLSDADAATSTVLALDPREAVISDNHGLLTRSLQYAKDLARIAAPSELLQKYIDELALEEPPAGEELAVAMVNEESRITNLIFVFEEFIGTPGISDRVAAAMSAQGLTFADVTGLKLTADLATADQLNGEFTLYCPNVEAATRLAKVFEQALTQTTAAQPQSSVFKLAGSAAGRGATVVVSLKITGIKAWIDQKLPVDEGAIAAGITQPAAAAPAAAPQNVQ